MNIADGVDQVALWQLRDHIAISSPCVEYQAQMTTPLRNSYGIGPRGEAFIGSSILGNDFRPTNIDAPAGSKSFKPMAGGLPIVDSSPIEASALEMILTNVSSGPPTNI